MLEGRLRRSMVEVLRDNRIRLTALTSPGLAPGICFHKNEKKTDFVGFDNPSGRILLLRSPDECAMNVFTQNL